MVSDVVKFAGTRRACWLKAALVAGTAVTALAPWSVVKAQCVRTSPSDVQCAGNDPGPVVVTGNGQTVIVDASATVSDLRVVGDDNTVDNDGSVSNNATRFAIELEANGGDALVDNSGTVDATHGSRNNIGIAIVNRGANGRSILNSSGSITASGDITAGAIVAAVGTDSSAEVAIASGGTIDVTGGQGADGVIVQTASAAQLINDGTINVLSNAGGGSAIGVRMIGVTTNGAIINRGTIDVEGQFGFGIVQSGSGLVTLLNEGTIDLASTGFRDAAVSQFIGNGDSLIENSGTITSSKDAIGFVRAGIGESQIVNTATGLMEGGDAAIRATVDVGPFQIINEGTLRSTSTVNNPAAIATIFIRSSAATSAASTLIANAGTIEAAGTQAIRVEFIGNDSCELDNSGSIVGNIVVSSATPTTILNSGTITGNIGLTAGDDRVTMQGANAAFTGLVRGRGGNDTFEILATDDFLLGNLVEDFETVLIDDGSVILDGARFTQSAGAFSLTISDDSSALLRGGAEFVLADAGTIALDGLLVVDPAGTLSATSTNDVAAFIAHAGSTVRFGLDSGMSLNGMLNADTVTFASGSQIDIDVRDLDVLVKGTTFDVATARDALTDDSGALTDNSVLFDFTKQVVNGTVLRITMEQLLSIADTINPTDPNSGALAGALQGLIDSGSPSGNSVSTVLGQISNVADLTVAVNDLAPDNSNGAALLALDMVDQTHRIFRLRQAARIVADGDVAMWLHGGVFGSELDTAGVFDGFEGNGWDIAGGIDASFGGSVVAGVGFGHASGDYDRTGTRAGAGDISASRVFLYALGEKGPFHFNADLGFGWGDANFTRSIAVLSDTVTGETGVDQFFGRVELGYTFGASDGEGFAFTPVVGIQMAEIGFDAYDESGSPGALGYSERSISSTRGDIGAIASYAASREGGSGWRFDADIRYVNEFNDLDDPLRAAFIGGGNGFAYAVNGPGDSGLTAELGAHFALGKAGMISLGYQGAFGRDGQLHAGTVTYSLGF